MKVHYHPRLHEPLLATGCALGLLVLAFGCTAEIGGAGPGVDGLGAASGDGASTGSGGAGTGGVVADEDASLKDFSRLTRAEYSATVSEALGVFPNLNLIPEDGRIGPFTSNVSVTPDPVHPYLLLAEELAAELIPAELPACEAGSVEICLEEEYRAPLERLLRRPLSDSDLSLWAGVIEEVQAAGGDDVQATRAMLGGALVSPDFLFRASPSNGGENAWARRAGEWLGYVLWDAPPDAELRNSVEDSSADLGSTLQTEAARLALDARATPVLARFFGQWLDVDTDLRMDESDAFATSPDYLELVGFIEEAMVSAAPVTDFVGGNWGVVHPDHAELYGVDASENGIARVEWPEESLRRGLLGQELLAGSTRHPDEGRRPIFRGLLVRRALLCDELPLPNPDLVALAGEVEDRTVDERCAGCHQHIDPIGHAFAAFDPEFEGAPPAANVLDHPELAGTHANVAELLEAVAGSRAFAECFSRKWLAFFLEQESGEVSASWVTSLADSVEAGASLAAIIEQTALEFSARSETAIPWCEGE